MVENIGNIILIVIVSVVVIICSISIIIASVFQNKKNKKYKEFINIINENKEATFQVKDGLSKEDINKIDSEVDVDSLIKELYDTYLTLEKKIKSFDSDFDDILEGNLKEFNIKRIENFKEKGYSDINDGIELLNYSIVEYSKNKLKFRLTVNCFSYKTVNAEIVSGSNVQKIEKILLLSYAKIDGKWLISSYEKIYEKKLSN